MRRGECLCGAIKFELSDELQMFALCHCRDCQHLTGGEPAALAIVTDGAFQLTKGTPKVYRRQGESGNTVDRHFCPDCGTHLASWLQGGLVAVKVGTLETPLAMQPTVEIWTSSAQPWAHHPEGIARFEKNPG